MVSIFLGGNDAHFDRGCLRGLSQYSQYFEYIRMHSIRTVWQPSALARMDPNACACQPFRTGCQLLYQHFHLLFER